MGQLAVTAIGADRPGIIARATGVLHEHGCNLQDSTMTILGGQFAMMLLVEAAEAAPDLEQALADATADLGLVVAVREVGAGAHSDAATHVLSVYGSDRPGIVHAVARHLAERGINVTDVTTRVLEGETPVYAMMMEIAVPDDVEVDALGDALASQVEGVEVTVRPLDVATF